MTRLLESMRMGKSVSLCGYQLLYDVWTGSPGPNTSAAASDANPGGVTKDSSLLFGTAQLSSTSPSACNAELLKGSRYKKPYWH